MSMQDICTCMPAILTPRELEVELETVYMCFCILLRVAPSPCCLVPTFRSSTHGEWYLEVRFSRIM